MPKSVALSRLHLSIRQHTTRLFCTTAIAGSMLASAPLIAVEENVVEKKDSNEQPVNTAAQASGDSSHLQTRADQNSHADQDAHSKVKTLDTALYDWHPIETLSDEQKALVKPGCNGLYIDPKGGSSDTSSTVDRTNLLAQPSDNDSNKEPDIIVEADYASVLNGTQASLTGNVVVTRGDTSLNAGGMQYDRLKDEAELQNGVVIRQPGILIRGDSAKVEMSSNISSFNGAKFILHDSHIRGSAESIGQKNADVVELRNGMITSCEPGAKGWRLEGESLSINRSSQMGTGKNVKLKVGDIPILYLPYITYPIGDQRKTGFLIPVPSSSEDGGLDIAVPFYWNIAENYDATIAPRLITSQGLMFETEFRHLNTWAEGELNLAFLNDDKGSGDKDLDDIIDEGEIPEDEIRPHKGKDRWLISLNQYGGDTRGLYIKNDFSKVSDIDYFRDLGTSSFSARNNSQLNQIFQVGYQNNHWDFGVRTESHQVLLDDISNPYKSIPQINGDGFYTFKNASLILDNEYTEFQSTSNTNAIEGRRLVQDYRLRWDNRSQWGFAIPEVGYKNLNYDINASQTKDLDQDLQEQQYDAFQASLDMGLKFERNFNQYTHTIEPRFYYLYREYVDQSDMFNLIGEQDLNFDTFYRTFSYDQLFRDSRYIGSDRIDDANQYTLGLSSRFYETATGLESFRFSLGKIYYRDDRQVSLGANIGAEDLITDSSELALETAFRISNTTQVVLNGIYDSKQNETQRSSGQIHYANKDYSRIVNLAYVHTLGDDNVEDSETLEQLDVSAAFQVTPTWALMGRSNFDIQNSRELETFVGLEYDNCCYRIRLLGRKWLDSNIAALDVDENAKFDIGFFFELELKGFGGSGATVNSILEDGVFGFEERNKYRN